MDGELLVEWAPIGQQIWDMKYRLKDQAGIPIDKTIHDTWRRVAKALAAPEGTDAELWEKRFYDALSGFKFLPGGRVIAGAGTAALGREVTLFNCFVMGTIPDTMDGIFSHLREAALTMQQGGGIGYDFSTLRPKGAPVVGVGADASGPLSFMDVWDAMCRTIMSAGSRRGAMMGTLRCDHPDIEDFIDAKRDPARLRMFNLSVLVTDDFMRAVKDGLKWQLQFGGRVYKTLDARGLWERLMRATYDVAEPGVIFIDRVNRRNNLAYCEQIAATNPCGEQPLPPYGNCLLGSINLAALVEEPFTKRAHIAAESLQQLAGLGVRMLDNVIEISRFPLAAQREEAFAKRRIGLGVTGLADALMLCGRRYGSDDGVALASNWLSTIEDAAYRESVELAAEKGPFPLFEAAKYLAGDHISRLPDPIREGIAKHGIRNSHLLSIAPTGTISLLAGNVSSGVEPPFSLEPYSRMLLLPDGSRRECEVADFAYAAWRQLKGDEKLPDYFADAQTLLPEDHLRMLAVVQARVDAGVSKTVNLPPEIPFEAFQGVYRQAYELGCKSCTTYRPNAVTGSVLSVKPQEIVENHAEPAEAPREAAPIVEDDGVVRLQPPLASPDEVAGRRYRVRWPDSDHALYVICTDIEEHGRLRPWELFLISNEAESDEWRIALGRMISAVYRRGGDVAFVAKELKAIFDKKGGAWLDGKRVPSLPAAIGAVIERHLQVIGFLPPPAPAETAALAEASGKIISVATTNSIPLSEARPRFRQCPKCGEAALIRSENCDRCTQCDYAKC